MAFLSPDLPPPPVLPPPPEIVEVPTAPERSDAQVQQEAADRRRVLSAQQGRGGTLLGGSLGPAGSAISGSTLLGG